MDDASSPQGESPTAPSINPNLQQALEKRAPRYFAWAEGVARGQTGRQDTTRFAEEFVILQEGAEKIGENLGMNSIGYGACYDGNEAAAFRFDPKSDPGSPRLVGALVNRRMPMRELLQGLDQYLQQLSAE